MATYSIIGAGSSSGNPVTVFMGCEDSVNICWTGRKTTSGYCSECYYFDDQYCSTISGISVSTTGTVSWQGNSVYYKIVKSCQPEPIPQSCSTYTYSDFSFYTVPTYVEADYDGYIDIYYSYTVTCLHADGSIGGIDNLSDMESVPFSSFTSGDTVYTYDFAPISDVCSACSGVAQVYITSDKDTCDSGTTVNVTTTFSPSVVPALPASGTDVTISIRCKTVEVDEDCTKRVTNTSSALTWHVSCATDCCIDHVVSSSITVSDIRAIAGVDSTATIKYNGVKVISSSIPYSITQKAKYTEECSGSSDDKETKYCVDSGSVKVEYETAYLSNRWTENGVVPFGGGRIKVSWNYSACTDSLCTPNTWEEIIEVESCDERAESPGDGCIYTSGSDGRVSGSCVIYFKEQSDGCDTCEGESPGEGYGVFNKITYNFEQDCQTTCQDYTTVVYDKKTITVGKCFTGTTSTTVPYSSITEHIGVLCPSATTETGNETVEVNITSINNSDSARTIFESDKVIVQQEAGPCSSDTQCGVAIKVESGLEGTDTAFLGFTDTEGTAQYNARNGELIEYYTDDNDGVSVTIDSDPDNNEDYRYKLVDGTDYITGFDLDCGESASTVAVKYCGCKKLKGVTGETVPATGGSGIEVATYSATTCTGEWKLSAMTASEDTPNIIDLSTIEFDDDNGVLKATVNSACTERTGDYVIYNTVTSTSCKTGSFTVTQSAYECGCSDMNFTVPESIELGHESGSSSSVTITNYGCCLPYSATVVDRSDWLDIVLDGDKITFTTISENPEVAPISGTVKFIAVEDGGVCDDGSSIEVTQAGAECNCGNMHFEVSPTAVNLGSEAGSMAEVSITNYICIPPYSDMDDWLDITLNESEDKFIISSKTANESSEERVGIIEFKFNEGDEPCSSPTITVTQSGQEIPGCPEMNRQGTEIPAGDGSSGYPIAYWTPSDDYPLNTFSSSYTGDGITDVVLTAITFGADTVNAIILKCSANPSTTPRDFKIELTTSVNEDCDWIFELTQDGAEPTPTCGCNSITFNGGEFEEDEYEGIPVYRIEIDKSSQRITAATIDSDCIPRNRSLDKYETITTNNDWQDIVNGDSTPGDTELILVINANNASSSREGYGKIMYDIDGTECTTIIHLVQSGTVTVCDCNNVTWNGTQEADPT